MFTYPSSVPPAAQAYINHAVKEADEMYNAVSYHVEVIGDSRSALSHVEGGRTNRDQAKTEGSTATKGFQHVMDMVIDQLSQLAIRHHWSVSDFEQLVFDLMEQRIVWMYAHQHRRATTLLEFTSQMECAFETFPSCQRYEAICVELLAASTTPPTESPLSKPGRSTDNQPLLTFQEAAKQLHVSADTVSRMEAEGKLKTVRLGEKIVRVKQAEIDRLLKASEKYHHRRAPSRRKKSRR